MTFQLGLIEISLGMFLLAVLQYLVTLWLSTRFKSALQKENAVFLEKLRWEFKTREHAAKVAEYMALARVLKESSSDKEYRKANQLAWELAMWLPTNIYKTLGLALVKPDEKKNPLSIVVDVRKVLLGDAAGDLTQDDIIQHMPGIGKKLASKALPKKTNLE